MLREQTLGPTSVGDDAGESRTVRLDRHEGEPGGGSLLRVRAGKITVWAADSETADREL